MTRKKQPKDTAAIHEWKVFFRDLFPERGDATTMAKHYRTVVKAGVGPAPKDDYLVTWLRMLLRKNIIPRVDTVWNLAEVSRLSGHNWVAGPVALFAASFFEPFVQVIVQAKDMGIPLRSLIRLVECVDTAVNRSQNVIDINEEIEDNTTPEEDRIILRKKLKKILRYRRKDRNGCVLSETEHSVMQKAWNNREKAQLEFEPFLVIAASMNEYIGWSLMDRRRIVTINLLEWLRKQYG